MKGSKEPTTDIRIPKSRAERQAELAGLSQEDRDKVSEAAQKRVHKQVAESRERAKKLVAAGKARRLRAAGHGGPEEAKDDSEGRGDGAKV